MSGRLKVNNIGKSYRKWSSEWKRMASWFFPSIIPNSEDWVLRNINFSVNPGEAIGIIGQNGAGKSTLLKIITGTTGPTEGKVQVSGSVAAILELGMGFNMEMTGRQNAYHSAGLMGHSRADIEKVMPEIESFAEIGDYFDKPVRTYSTGMQARVAFAVVTAFRPNILIVDEVLSVGDAYFQAKCFERIASYKAQGTTLLLVTHSINDVVKHCNRALFIRAGHLVFDGPSKDATNLYLEELFGKRRLEDNDSKDNDEVSLHELMSSNTECFHRRPCYRKEEHRWGNGGAKILDYLYVSNGASYPQLIESNSLTEFYFNVKFEADFDDITAGFLIKTHDGVFLYGTNSFLASEGCREIISVKAGEVIVFKFVLPMAFNAGHYLVSFGISTGPQELLEPLDRRYDSVLLTVKRAVGFWGLADLQAQFGLERKGAGVEE